MILSEQRGRLGAALSDDDVQAGDLFAVDHQIVFLFGNHWSKPDTQTFQLLAHRHRDHKSLLVRGDAITAAQHRNISGKRTPDEEHCQKNGKNKFSHNLRPPSLIIKILYVYYKIQE